MKAYNEKVTIIVTEVLGGLLIGASITPLVTNLGDKVVNSLIYEGLFKAWIISAILTIIIYLRKISEK